MKENINLTNSTSEIQQDFVKGFNDKGEEGMDSCRFCNIYKADVVGAVSDIVLYENEFFFIIPALGCLVKNYIMIISKRHINSLCFLNEVEKKGLITLLNEIRAILKEKYGFYPIVFEHGASNYASNNSACSVLHAHLHIVPYKINEQAKMINSLNLTKINDLNVFLNIGYDKNYIFFMDNLGEIFYKCATNQNEEFPSQIIRKCIAKDIGKTMQWDWRYYPFNENIETTVAELKPLIRKSIKVGDYRLKYIYYCRAIDGLNINEVEAEYNYVQKKLAEQGRILVNPFSKVEHQLLKVNKVNSELIVTENIKGISKADCVIVNLSIKNHLYVGCIAEMIYAKERGCYVIVLTGDSGVENHFYTLYHADKICYDMDELFSLEDWRFEK